jgi:hypothetical protein
MFAVKHDKANPATDSYIWLEVGICQNAAFGAAVGAHNITDWASLSTYILWICTKAKASWSEGSQ